MRWASDESGSTMLWVSLSMPVLILMFLYLYLSIAAMDVSTEAIRDSADLAAVAAAGVVDQAAMLQGTVAFDEPAAETEALEVMEANLTGQKVPTTSPVQDLVSFPPPLDGTNNPADAGDGIGVIFLHPEDGDIDPRTGGTVLKPSVAVVYAVTVRAFSLTIRIPGVAVASPL